MIMNPINNKPVKPISASQAIAHMQEFCKGLGLNLVHDKSKYNNSNKTAFIHFIKKINLKRISTEK